MARPASEITIAEIIAAVDENKGKEKTMKLDDRHQKTQELWEALSHQITDYLSNITIGDLVNGNQPVQKNDYTAKSDIDEIDVWTTAANKHTNSIT